MSLCVINIFLLTRELTSDATWTTNILDFFNNPQFRTVSVDFERFWSFLAISEFPKERFWGWSAWTIFGCRKRRRESSGIKPARNQSQIAHQPVIFIYLFYILFALEVTLGQLVPLNDWVDCQALTDSKSHVTYPYSWQYDIPRLTIWTLIFERLSRILLFKNWIFIKI